MTQVFIIVFLFVPALAEAAPQTFQQLANLVTNLINGGIGVALILGIVIYFFAISTSLRKSASGEMSSLRTQILWGILALFIMFSVWGILGLIRNTLFGGGTAGGLSTGGSGRTQVFCRSIDDCPRE